MSEKLTITKEELVTLLKAAQAAYKGQAKPPDSASDTWVEWYAKFIIDKLQPVAVEAAPKVEAVPSVPSEPAAKPAAPAEPAKADQQPATAPLPSTAKLPERPPTPPQPAVKTVAAQPEKADAPEAEKAAVPTTDKLDENRRGKTEPDAGVLQVCPTCAHRNRPGVLFCENCGTNLMTGQQAALGTRDLREAAAEVESPDARKAAAPSENQTTVSPILLDKEQEKAVRTAGTTVFSVGMLLRIEVEGGSTPIVIKPKAEDMILGRRDPTTGATPEVDLTAYAGYRMGVSRRHASLALENNQLSLWDLGSSNGTFINGNRLTPHQPNPLRDGDEVRLGQMVLRLFFQNAPSGAS